MPKSTSSIAGQAHRPKTRVPAPQHAQYRPQLNDLPGVHPEVVRAIQTIFDNLYELRSAQQRAGIGVASMSPDVVGATASYAASLSQELSSPVSGSSVSSSSNESKSSRNKASGNDPAYATGILGLQYNAATDPLSLKHGSITTYNSTTGQFDFSTPAGFVNAPTSSSASGVAGQIAHDGSSFYVCVAPNQWMKAALSTF